MSSSLKLSYYHPLTVMQPAIVCVVVWLSTYANGITYYFLSNLLKHNSKNISELYSSLNLDIICKYVQ